MPTYLYLILGLLSLIWGASFFFIKILLESFGPWSIAFLRCFFGVIILALIIIIRKEKFNFSHLPWGVIIAVGLFNSTIPWYLIAYSEQSISSGLASVLNATTPIWTLVLGIIFFKLRSTIYQAIGIILGFIGILILVDIDWRTLEINQPLAIGAMLIVTLSYGWASQMSKRHFQNISVYHLSLMTLLVGTISSAIMAFIYESPSLQAISETKNLLSLIGLGTFGSGIGYILFYQLIQKGSAEFATLVTYLVPAFALLWGYIFLNEVLTLQLFLGLIVILMGVFISGRKKKEETLQVK